MMVVKCKNCGEVNPEGKRFCSMCGESLALNADDSEMESTMKKMPYQRARHVEAVGDMGTGKIEKLLFRLFGGLGWLMVSIGTFMVAFGYLGMIDSIFSYSDDPQDSLNLIGYGIIAYAVAAIFVAVNRFVKSH